MMPAFIEYILYTDWVSWIIHLAGFYILCRWSGICWPWALGLILGIEIWETLDWSPANPALWWTRSDTWIDILSGIAGAGWGYRAKFRKHNESKNTGKTK